MSHRVNILLEDQVWQALQSAPKGERSRLVNQALSGWFIRRGRQDAARQMDVLRQKLPVVSDDKIVQWLREDRDRV